MDAATIQAKVYAGYAKAAARVGLPFDIYRPTAPITPAPLDAGNKLATLPAWFTAQEPKGARPNTYGKSVWWGQFDGSQTKVGDYLVGAPGTFFVASRQPLLPIQAVQCNRVVSIARASGSSAVGALGYNADTPSSETPLMTNWPASMLAGTKGEANEVGLPGDVRQPWWQVLMPAWPGVVFMPGDILTDDLGRRCILSLCELTDMGWRITAQQAST